MDETDFSPTSLFTIETESSADDAFREALLDRMMGPRRRSKTSEHLRRGQRPVDGLALAARNSRGDLIGSVRLWNVHADGTALLLLGPLAVDGSFAGCGVGSALMRCALGRAAELGHGGVILVGDAGYYRRFGFCPDKAGGLLMPGPVERDRFLGAELIPGYLAGARGMLVGANEPCACLPAPPSLQTRPEAA